MNAVGWSMFITAESLVLYSRMHLVTRNVVVHRFVLGMIIFTGLRTRAFLWKRKLTVCSLHRSDSGLDLRHCGRQQGSRG